MGIEPFLVGSAVDCVLAQRLARRLCDEVQGGVRPDAGGAGRRPASRGRTASRCPTLYRPVGCSVCAKTGYKGRLALHEVMPMTEEIERLTVEHAVGADDHPGGARAGDGRRCARTGWHKVVQGVTSIDEILRVVV